jgi:hypothetical protein
MKEWHASEYEEMWLKILMFCNDNHESCSEPSCETMEFAGDTKIDYIY